MAKKCPRICANCKHWKCCFANCEYPEDECGTCHEQDDVVYGDEPACEKFVECSPVRVRAVDWRE